MNEKLQVQLTIIWLSSNNCTWITIDFQTEVISFSYLLLVSSLGSNVSVFCYILLLLLFSFSAQEWCGKVDVLEGPPLYLRGGWGGGRDWKRELDWGQMTNRGKPRQDWSAISVGPRAGVARTTLFYLGVACGDAWRCVGVEWGRELLGLRCPQDIQRKCSETTVLEGLVFVKGLSFIPWNRSELPHIPLNTG